MNAIEKIIFNELASRRAIALPRVGALRVVRRHAHHDGEHMRAPENKVVYSLESDNDIPAVTSLGVGEHDYLEWLAMALRNDELNISGVGTLILGEFTPSPELERALNPASATISDAWHDDTSGSMADIPAAHVCDIEPPCGDGLVDDQGGAADAQAIDPGVVEAGTVVAVVESVSIPEEGECDCEPGTVDESTVVVVERPVDAPIADAPIADAPTSGEPIADAPTAEGPEVDAVVGAAVAAAADESCAAHEHKHASHPHASHGHSGHSAHSHSEHTHKETTLPHDHDHAADAGRCHTVSAGSAHAVKSHAVHAPRAAHDLPAHSHSEHTHKETPHSHAAHTSARTSHTREADHSPIPASVVIRERRRNPAGVILLIIAAVLLWVLAGLWLWRCERRSSERVVVTTTVVEAERPATQEIEPVVAEPAAPEFHLIVGSFETASHAEQEAARYRRRFPDLTVATLDNGSGRTLVSVFKGETRREAYNKFYRIAEQTGNWDMWVFERIPIRNE